MQIVCQQISVVDTSSISTQPLKNKYILHLIMYTHACIRTYMHTYVRTYTHMYVHTYVRTYIHTYIHTLHMYVHTYIRHFGVAVANWCSHKVPTMLRRHSWSNGSSSRSWLSNWCPPEAPFSQLLHHRVGKILSRKADQSTLDSRGTVHG